MKHLKGNKSFYLQDANGAVKVMVGGKQRTRFVLRIRNNRAEFSDGTSWVLSGFGSTPVRNRDK
jgi:hypothetical protein